MLRVDTANVLKYEFHYTTIKYLIIPHLLLLTNNVLTALGLVQLLKAVLEANKSLTFLNLESNFLSGMVIVELVQAINKNQTIIDFKVANQVGPRMAAVMMMMFIIIIIVIAIAILNHVVH